MGKRRRVYEDEEGRGGVGKARDKGRKILEESERDKEEWKRIKRAKKEARMRQDNEGGV